jgi:hypothetical protein
MNRCFIGFAIAAKLWEAFLLAEEGLIVDLELRLTLTASCSCVIYQLLLANRC